jgi:hypothetical protein
MISDCTFAGNAATSATPQASGESDVADAARVDVLVVRAMIARGAEFEVPADVLPAPLRKNDQNGAVGSGADDDPDGPAVEEGFDGRPSALLVALLFGVSSSGFSFLPDILGQRM